MPVAPQLAEENTMNNFKRFTVAAIAGLFGVLVLSLASCTGKADTTPNSDHGTTARLCMDAGENTDVCNKVAGIEGNASAGLPDGTTILSDVKADGWDLGAPETREYLSLYLSPEK